MIRIDLQCPLEILNRGFDVSCARSQDAKVIPSVRNCAGVTCMQLQNLLETLARPICLLALQVCAPQTVQGFGALWIVYHGLLKVACRLFKIAALVKNKTKGEMVSPVVVRFCQSGKRQRLRQALRISLRDRFEIRREMLFGHRPLINLYHTSCRIDQKGHGNTHVAVAVKQLAKKKIVDGDDFWGSPELREGIGA